MEIVIHRRNGELAEDFRSIVNEKLTLLNRFKVKIDRIEVEVLHQNNPKLGKSSHDVVITAHGSGPFIRAEASSFNDVAAFDQAVKSFELQIRKIHERAKDYGNESVRTKKSLN